MFINKIFEGKVLTAVGVVAIAAAMFAAGWHLAPDQMVEGYSNGNEDGYSIGYVDGMNSNQPDLHRFMTHEDYAFRREIGGREVGE